MARKGSRKVRTGCLTCKVRKVKCDEEKPACRRCYTTGRHCDGYNPVGATAAATINALDGSGLTLHRPKHILCGHTADLPGGMSEGRAIQFFCEAAGPYLSGATDPYFWTQLVMQFAGFEPAVKHSLVAISSLYEKYRHQPDSRAVCVWDNSVALKHYNASIRELKDMTTEDKQPLVLLVCILFICIEFLQSNREAAIAHCKHGIEILERTAPRYPWTREHLVPIFRRLTLFPFLFGNSTSDYPNLVDLENPAPEEFLSFFDAQHMMDYIFSRTLRLVRQGDAYRFGNSRHETPPANMLTDQEGINQMLDRWQVHFASFEGDPSLPDTPATKHFKLGVDYLSIMSRCFLLIRYEVCRVWSNLALEGDETCYDAYLENFGRIFTHLVTLSSTVPAASKAVGAGQSLNFMFEMGFMPALFLVVTKCRHLEMRLEALRNMRILALPRENLWELNTVFALGRRIIEMEHNVQVDESGHLVTPKSSVSLPSPSSHASFPPDYKRIRHSWTDPKSTLRSIRGRQVRGRMIGFVKQSQKGNPYLHTEFLVEEAGTSG